MQTCWGFKSCKSTLVDWAVLVESHWNEKSKGKTDKLYPNNIVYCAQDCFCFLVTFFYRITKWSQVCVMRCRGRRHNFLTTVDIRDEELQPHSRNGNLVHPASSTRIHWRPCAYALEEVSSSLSVHVVCFLVNFDDHFHLYIYRLSVCFQ